MFASTISSPLMALEKLIQTSATKQIREMGRVLYPRSSRKFAGAALGRDAGGVVLATIRCQVRCCRQVKRGVQTRDLGARARRGTRGAGPR